MFQLIRQFSSLLDLTHTFGALHSVISIVFLSSSAPLLSPTYKPALAPEEKSIL
jgi:hypothetical protein